MFARHLVAPLSLLAMPLWLWGCGGGTAGQGVSDASFVVCATDPSVMPFQTNLPVTSDGGAFVVKVLNASPAAPVKGQNSWQVEVDDAALNTPLDGLSVMAVPYMPLHNHGTTPVMVTGIGGGAYTFVPLYLYMPGIWQIQIYVNGALTAGVTQKATISVCIN